MLDVPIVLVADEFKKLGVRLQREAFSDRPELRVGFQVESTS
jgi:hypothetical protein